MYEPLIDRFTEHRMLVIGDLMLDVYLKGASTRLTPEAPVPVVDILSGTTVAGGGGNTAMNLRLLGAEVTFCSITGCDNHGNKARSLLQDAGINCVILQHKSRKTIVKTRIMAGDRLLLRYDKGTDTPVSSELEAAFIAVLEEQLKYHQTLIIADYNKGLITPAVISYLEAACFQTEKFIAVDSGRLHCFSKLSPSLVKPNYKEAMALTGLPVKHVGRVQQVSEAGSGMFHKTGAAVTAITLDEEGAVIFDGPHKVYRCYAHPVSSPQVAGAGDVYLSAFALASLSGADIAGAAELSAAAAAVAISKKVTASCSLQELRAYLAINEKYVSDIQQLEYVGEMYRGQGKKIVFTNGCFDILHSGHVNYLNKARELGDVLIVGINTDTSIRRLKGTTRPINQLADRMEVLAGLGAVDHIIPFGSEEDDTPIPLIRALKPHIVTKGSDYTKDQLPEAGAVNETGGEIVLLPLLPNRSTTNILDRIHAGISRIG